MQDDIHDARELARMDQQCAHFAEFVAEPGWLDVLLDWHDPQMLVLLRVVVRLNRAAIERNMARWFGPQTDPATLNRIWTQGGAVER